MLHVTDDVFLIIQDRLQELRGTDPDNFDRFEAQMRLHRAWYFGDGHGEGKSLSAEEVQELSESLCSLARQVRIPQTHEHNTRTNTETGHDVW